MEVDRQTRELETVPETAVETKQAQEESASQEAVPFLPFDEALLDAFLEVGGLRSPRSARGSEWQGMQCYACRDSTHERCSYCLLPVCQKHGGRVTPWFTSRQVMVCAPCQERLREMAQEEESLDMAEPVRYHGSTFA